MLTSSRHLRHSTKCAALVPHGIRPRRHVRLGLEPTLVHRQAARRLPRDRWSAERAEDDGVEATVVDLFGLSIALRLVKLDRSSAPPSSLASPLHHVIYCHPANWHRNLAFAFPRARQNAIFRLSLLS